MCILCDKFGGTGVMPSHVDARQDAVCPVCGTDSEVVYTGYFKPDVPQLEAEIPAKEEVQVTA